jgi:hypothetical protein
VLASTRSWASFSTSSFGPYRGERGRAINPVDISNAIAIVRSRENSGVRDLSGLPVRADSRIPKGAMSFIKASIREGFAELRVHIIDISVPAHVLRVWEE